MASIWQLASGYNYIKPIMAIIYRVVESQEKIATLGLVNNVYEQGILEELIESTKQFVMKESENLHYLLSTPFRYPPLQYGSRFGTAFEQGIFYGSLSLATALAETAYYRFVYLQGSEIPFSQTIYNEFSTFTVKIRSELGVYLDQQPFIEYEETLVSPTSYVVTQQLGSEMRNDGVEIFQYISARDKNKGANVGLFTSKGFLSKKPVKLEHWFCQTTQSEIGFLAKDGDQRFLFKRKDFLVGDTFPSPAV